MKYFNISGPCNSGQHYMIDASTRLRGVKQLIGMNQYFVIHAARQSGKTTYLKDLTKRLHTEGKYYVLYCSLESLQEINTPEVGIPEIVKKIQDTLFVAGIPNAEQFAQNADYGNFTAVLNKELTRFCRKLDKPLVIFFDESDCLSNGTLISFLRQLREGYVNRDMTPFVYSVALVGMRNIRDYKARIREERESLGSASPFNIVTEALTLKNFTKDEIRTLYSQHTAETGQVFEDEMIDYVYEQTKGQPWLVNAIAREIIVKMLEYDYSQTITKAMAEPAIQTIILRRDTHIDSLLERLKEDRVRKIIEPVITGSDSFIDRLSDDYQYAKDLGLITDENHSRIEPSNPIYREVITRALSFNFQEDFTAKNTPYSIPKYIRDGKIDMNLLLTDFQQFWRENSAIWTNKTQYLEAAPHLILNGFLQKVVNGGGQIIRDMAAGSGRLDLCVVYENRKYPLEVKLWYSEQYYRRGLEQTARYIDTFGCDEGWIALFDRNEKKTWDERIYRKEEICEGKKITVFGM